MKPPCEKGVNACIKIPAWKLRVVYIGGGESDVEQMPVPSDALAGGAIEDGALGEGGVEQQAEDEATAVREESVELGDGLGEEDVEERDGPATTEEDPSSEVVEEQAEEEATAVGEVDVETVSEKSGGGKTI